MASFFAARGCVYEVKTPAEGGTGFYSLEGLSSGNQGGSALLIQGVDILSQDIIQPVNTLEDMKIIYEFGTDFGNATIIGEILMGPKGGSNQSFKSVVDYFKNKRISKTKTSVRLSTPGGGYNVFLKGLQIGAIDPALHVQPFAFIGIIAE